MNNLSRLIGQETEYAIRFTADDPTAEKPSNSLIYQCIKESIEELVSTHDSDRNQFQEQFFVQNGGSFNYEFLPFAIKDGLVEGGTPECSHPFELLKYQKAQEALLLKALPNAKEFLENLGYSGSIGLIKNCRDSEGNIYGAQENYELNLSKGLSFFIYKCGLIVYSATMLLLASIAAIVLIALLLAAIVLTPFVALIYAFFKFLSIYIPLIRKPIKKITNRISDISESINEMVNSEEEMLQKVGQWEYKYLFPIENITFIPIIFWQKIFAFKTYRKELEAFFISRIILSGAGSLLEDNRFVLSEKASAVKRMYRTNIEPYQRPLFDNGNLIKELMLAGLYLLSFRFTRYKQLFRKRQRFQLGMADSNRCQIAEYLKLSISSLMMDMVEAGYLTDYPVIKKPIEAVHIINSDPSLKAKVKLKNGKDISAIEIQQYYLEKAKEYIQKEKAISIEVKEIVDLWDEMLTQLDIDPSKLIGRIDWVTKRYLIEASAKDEGYTVQKKIDIAYHELGTGYYNNLENKGIAPKLITEEEIEKAIYEPSSPERVQIRSKYIQEALFEGDPIKISWNSIQIGNKRNRTIINLNDYKDNC